MEPIEIGLWVSGGLLLMVVLGMRVAFAAGLAGFVGLVWLRWNGFDYDPERFWIIVKIAGLTPHSKVSAQALSLILSGGSGRSRRTSAEPCPRCD